MRRRYWKVLATKFPKYGYHFYQKCFDIEVEINLVVLAKRIFVHTVTTREESNLVICTYFFKSGHPMSYGHLCFSVRRREAIVSDLDKDGRQSVSSDGNEVERMIENPLAPIGRVSMIPGMVENGQDHHFDNVSDLDIDRVELIAESDEDGWSTPSLPALSLSSSEESLDHDHFDYSSQSNNPSPTPRSPKISMQSTSGVHFNLSIIGVLIRWHLLCTRMHFDASTN